MNKAKLNYLLDVVIGLAFLLSGVTGVAFLLMGSGGYQGGRNPGYAAALLGLSRETWSDLHTLASVVMIAGIVVHIALHWKWIVCLTKKMLPSLPRRANRAEDQVCEVIV
jgi:biotin transporter BioY